MQMYSVNEFQQYMYIQNIYIIDFTVDYYLSASVVFNMMSNMFTVEHSNVLCSL